MTHVADPAEFAEVRPGSSAAAAGSPASAAGSLRQLRYRLQGMLDGIAYVARHGMTVELLSLPMSAAAAAGSSGSGAESAGVTGSPETAALADSTPRSTPSPVPHLTTDHSSIAVRVRMPASPDNLNIAGSLHASALFCVAETAAGVAAWCIEANPATMVYVRGVDVRYPDRATGDVTAEAAVTGLTGNDAAVDVSVTDTVGRVVVSAAFSYALRRR